MLANQRAVLNVLLPTPARRYYMNKFHVDTMHDDPDFPRLVVQHYVEGLVWVMAYYYHGCVSWTWFYP